VAGFFFASSSAHRLVVMAAQAKLCEIAALPIYAVRNLITRIAFRDTLVRTS